MRCCSFAFAGVAALLCVALPAFAQVDGDGLITEFKIGAFDHDAPLGGHQKETGADVGGEILFQPVDFLDFIGIGSPRPILGGLVNSAGQTNQVYTGLTFTFDFAADVLRDGDGFFAEATVGGGLNDGKINVTDPVKSQEEKSLGSNVLFREDLDIGYRVTQRVSIAFSYNHISDADLAQRNEGLNDVGVRLGIKF
jgi:lipid A 3-O-deacylase